ncbi:heat shock 70 kDa protein 12A-like isoform X2 [Mizuhopecten yessoensis]|uniref:heat shock 70 kDa protein 12A-like isoform X2 n=1 Tax=Mizuhopecten yessoensis TaxID=6573 RepID=UPI000B45742D|nr:heat shock 70 kDa protein 12A-like isoform X2 [Mizuhopecten yessoensis]
MELQVSQKTQPRILKRDLKNSPYILVAALDFGTTYSGYAFSSRLEYTKNPLNISTLVWQAGSGNLASLKTSTCVLFKPDESFDTFGFEAEDKYAKLIDDDKHHDWFFFRRFKMSLYEQKDITRSMKLYAQNQKPMLAMKVFAEAVKYLKDHLLGTCEKRGLELLMSDVRWVLTVPAIWNDRAKQFMRECAQQAGIPGYQLVLSLEAEAAAMFCKYLPLKDMTVGKGGDNLAVFRPGSRYMVVDVGGGTVDITVHEVLPSLKLKEVHMANGGDWGGTTVDKEFEMLLSEILGVDVFNKFKQKHVADYLELQRSFETKKRSISSSTDAKITFTLPISLMETFDEILPNKTVAEKISSNKKYANNLTWKMDRLRIKSELAQTMFRQSVQRIIDHVVELMKHPEVEQAQAILLVGGYSECPLLQTDISAKFPDKRLIIPHEAGLAVLKGAVINGHELDTITERISRFTYGTKCVTDFIHEIHPMEKRKIQGNGKAYCGDIFSVHATKGEAIAVWESLESIKYNVTSPSQTSTNVEIYISTNSSPEYVTDEGCECIGSLEIEMPDTSKGMDRGIDAQFTFGGAEIEVQVKDRESAEEQIAYLNFLG